jgi:hypothetical protein
MAIEQVAVYEAANAAHLNLWVCVHTCVHVNHELPCILLVRNGLLEFSKFCIGKLTFLPRVLLRRQVHDRDKSSRH